MNLPKVSTSVCPADIVTDDETLVIKPSVFTGCVGGGLGGEDRFHTYLQTGSGGETEVTTGLTYSSSNSAVVAVNSSTGVVTLVAAGIATVTVTNGTLTAFAQIEVSGSGECCADVTVATLVLVDNSKSMGEPSGVGAHTKLAWGKKLAHAMVGAINYTKDVAGLMRFNETTTLIQAIGATSPTLAQINSIPQSSKRTDILNALEDAIALLDAETADRKVLVLISDGENRTEAGGDPSSPEAIIALANDFKAAGGILICVGVGATDDGYALLQSMASGGFLLNGYDDADNPAQITALTGFLNYYCGNPVPPYGDGTPTAVIPGPATDEVEA